MSAWTCLDTCGQANSSLSFSINHANKRHESSYRCWPCLLTLYKSPFYKSICDRYRLTYCSLRTVLAFIHRCSTSVLETNSIAIYVVSYSANNQVSLSLSLFLPFACRFIQSVDPLSFSVSFILHLSLSNFSFWNPGVTSI